jgi:hypothetical protein
MQEAAAEASEEGDALLESFSGGRSALLAVTVVTVVSSWQLAGYHFSTLSTIECRAALLKVRQHPLLPTWRKSSRPTAIIQSICPSPCLGVGTNQDRA